MLVLVGSQDYSNQKTRYIWTSITIFDLYTLKIRCTHTFDQKIHNFGQNENVFFLPPFKGGHTRRVCPEGVKRPRRVPVEKKQAAQNDLQGTANGQNCTHTCTRVRALNVTLPHPRRGCGTNPEGVGMHPYGVHTGTP